METSNITLRRLKTFLKSLENKFALKNHTHLSDSELSTTSMNPVQNKIVTAAINSASQQAGTANGILTQWQEQGRIPNGIANNLVTTEEGFALDARQGKAIDDKITVLNNSLAKEFVKDSTSLLNNNIIFKSITIEYNVVLTPNSTYSSATNQAPVKEGYDRIVIPFTTGQNYGTTGVSFIDDDNKIYITLRNNYSQTLTYNVFAFVIYIRMTH